MSSKIAAFQQQLFNPNASSEEDVSSTGSKQPESGIRKRSTENSVLLRFGGKAIPLPGMFNPNQMPKPSISHGKKHLMIERKNRKVQLQTYLLEELEVQEVRNYQKLLLMQKLKQKVDLP